MKQGIHPDYTKAIVACNGCGNTFETRATTDKIEVEICSNCHPFYTGKQKLVDVAGRVDKFRARQQAAKTHAQKDKTKTVKKEDNSETTESNRSADSNKKNLDKLKKTLAKEEASQKNTSEKQKQ
ncbi:MAG: 50S ribosomal protein L31 [Candidatus Saccharimonadales bacterium]